MNRPKQWWRAATIAAHGIQRSPLNVIAAVTAITIALTMSGAALLLQSQVTVMRGHWYEKADVTVYLCTSSSVATNCGGEASLKDKQTIEAILVKLPGVKSIQLETRQQAYSAFLQKFKGTDISRSVSAEALPESYRLQLVSGADPDQIETAMQTQIGVETVQNQRVLLNGFFQVVNRIQLGATILALLQSIGGIALIANLVRTALQQRTDEVQIMKLIGAPNHTIRAPFILEIMAVCVLGAIGAGGALYALTVITSPTISHMGGGIAVIGPSAVTKVWFLLATGSILAGLTISRLTLRRALRT